jgi:Glycosyl hydrolases family 2, TIM barrel domain/Glycosyl hydrolases family 2
LPASSLEPGRPNRLVVRVDDIKGPDSLPEDWWNWGGIVDPVALEPVGRVELSDLGVMPELGCRYRCGDLLVEGTLRNISRVQLTPRVLVGGTSPSGVGFGGGDLTGPLRPGASEQVSFRVPVPAPLALWSPSSPRLYQVQVKTAAGPRVEQDDTLQVGMRSVQVRGGILYLNGRRVWLRGAAIQEDMQGRGAALTDEDIDTIVSELRSLGANVTRAHYLLDPRLLDALDGAGIMVWSQAPVDHADAVLRTARGRAEALAALQATILGDRNHPSVIVDSVGNELSPTPDTTPGTRTYIDQAIGLARRLDPVVPVGLDLYGYPGYPVQATYKKLDVLGISDYFGWYTGPAGHSIADLSGLAPYLSRLRAAYPQQALAVSEFGTEALLYGSASMRGTFEFQSDYLQRTFAVLDRLPFMNGAIYWTLREFAVSPGWTGGLSLPSDEPPDGLHHKGLIGYDGTQKPAFTVAQQLFATQPAYVH